MTLISQDSVLGAPGVLILTLATSEHVDEAKLKWDMQNF